MKTIQRTALTLLFAVATSCVAYGQGQYQGPPGAPSPEYRGQPGYPGGQYPDNRGYNDPYQSPDWEVGFFYQELSPFGDWIYTYEYGWTWLPRDVGFGWRPYSYGRWVMSDYGWFWVSYEPFGWATYHYGRWTMHPRFGWIWCPGRTWGPAWVSWQYGRGYVGWAPLPPEIGFEIGIGLRLGGLNLSLILQPSAYTFVEERRFLEPDLDRHYVPSARNVTIIQNTTNITNYTYIDNRVVNRGVEVQRLERATGQRVRPMRIAETETRTDSRKAESVRGDEVVVYKPSKQRLDTVKVDENKPKRGRDERQAPKSERVVPQQRTDRSRPEEKGAVEVAPRVKPQPPVKEERVQRNEQKERQELEAYEREERQRLEKAQREEREKAKGRPQTDAAEIGKRQAEEKKALDEELKRSKQQLEGRQQVERKATQQQPPPGKKAADAKKAEEEKNAAAVKAEEQKTAEKKAAEKKAAEKKSQEKKNASQGKKKPQSDEPPPPLG